MTKRQKFILTSITLAFGLSVVQFAEISYRYLAISVLSFLAVILTWWSLREALGGIRWLTTIILPAEITASVGLFYFLLPATWLSHLPVTVAFAIGNYALLLTENIFSIAAIRTIQLFRAASAVGFLLTLLGAFLLYDTIFSFRLNSFLNSGFVFLASWPLLFHGFWSVNLEEKITKKLLLYSLTFSVILTEAAFFISFFPLTTAMSALFLTTGMYVILGLTQAYISERLFKQTIYEYFVVGVIVLGIMIFTGRWGG